MCRAMKWLISLGCVIGLIQSMIWSCLAIAACLVYLCVIPVQPYEDKGDFFRVTIVKLYFEGPGCIPNGDYLGQFNNDYRNSEVIDLLRPDIVFGVMILYFLLNALHVILSFSFFINRNAKSVPGRKRLVNITRGWSLLTLAICALDVLMTAAFVDEILKLKNYINEEYNKKISGDTTWGIDQIPFVPLTLAIVSSRFIILWVWNLILGTTFFFNSFCCTSSIVPKKEERKAVAEHPREPVKKPERLSARESYIRAFDVVPVPVAVPAPAPASASDSVDRQRSLEATTHFNESLGKKSQYSGSHRSFFTPSETFWPDPKPETSGEARRWEEDNKAFVHDEQTSVATEKPPDFDHNLNNFEKGQRKIKIVKPPLGKPEEEVRV